MLLQKHIFGLFCVKTGVYKEKNQEKMKNCLDIYGAQNRA